MAHRPPRAFLFLTSPSPSHCYDCPPVFIAAIRSAITYVAVSLYVLVTGVVGMLLATMFGWTGLLYSFGHGGVWLGLALSGIRYTVAGVERLPLDRAAVYC